MEIPEEKAIGLPMDEDDAVAEVRRVEQLLGRDSEALLQSDIDPVYVESFSTRVGAFAFAAAAVDAYLSAEKSAKQQWKERKVQGWRLREELMVTYAYVFRKHPRVLETLANIRKGLGNSDMLLDLLGLYILGNQRRQALAAANVDLSVVDSAKSLHGELSALLAATRTDPEEMAEAKLMRNRAWTYVHEALEEVYAAGRFVFRGDPVRRELYLNDYYQRIGGLSAAARRASEDDDTTAEVAAASATAGAPCAS
jgi:hypothetical protein